MTPDRPARHVGPARRERPVPRPPQPKPAPTNPPHVVLVGPPAAGKTTLARLMSERFGVPMRDTDAIISDTQGPIADIFAERGEAGFRLAEREAVDDAVRPLLDAPGVVSLGGGAVLHESTRTQLADPAITVVYITIDAATVAARIRNSTRPLLSSSGETPLQRWERLAAEREAVYRQVADVVVPTAAISAAMVVDRVAAALAKHERGEDEHCQEDCQEHCQEDCQEHCQEDCQEKGAR